MEKCSDFEAIAAYDMKNHINEGAKAGYVFIIDTDTCGAGVCRCLDGGETELIGSFCPAKPVSVKDSWSDALKTAGREDLIPVLLH